MGGNPKYTSTCGGRLTCLKSTEPSRTSSRKKSRKKRRNPIRCSASPGGCRRTVMLLAGTPSLAALVWRFAPATASRPAAAIDRKPVEAGPRRGGRGDGRPRRRCADFMVVLWGWFPEALPYLLSPSGCCRWRGYSARSDRGASWLGRRIFAPDAHAERRPLRPADRQRADRAGRADAECGSLRGRADALAPLPVELALAAGGILLARRRRRKKRRLPSAAPGRRRRRRGECLWRLPKIRTWATSSRCASRIRAAGSVGDRARGRRHRPRLPHMQPPHPSAAPPVRAPGR